MNWTSSLQLRRQKMVSKNLPVARLVLHVCPLLQSPLCTAGKVQKSKQPSVLEPKKSYNIGELFLLLAVCMYTSANQFMAASSSSYSSFISSRHPPGTPETAI